METYVVGTISMQRAQQGSIDGVIDRLSPVGYRFSAEPGGSFTFTKTGRVESVITELVPICEDHGLDVEDFRLVEYRKSDDSQRSVYDGGIIMRDR